MITLLIVYFCFMDSFPVLTIAACSWPSDFADTIWTDSSKGDLDFASTTMTGWTFSLFAVGLGTFTDINNWECVTYDSSGPFLVMKTTSTFEIFSDQFTGYRCLQLEKITDYSYRYYQMEPVQIQLSYDRLSVERNDSLTDTSTLCTVQPASGPEFQVMLKKGFEGAATVTCPYSLLADYSFKYTDSDGSVSCDPVNDVGSVNMCSNVTQLTIPSLACSQYPLYSSKDTLWCVDVVVVGTDTFVSLYNGLQEASSIDETNTYQFTCAAINAEGTSMSVTTQHCKASQSPTELPTNNAGSEVGVVLNLTVDGVPCPPCVVLSNPASGSVVITTNGAKTKATYTCEGNYSLSGNDTRFCQADGTWSDTQPSCNFSDPAIGATSDGTEWSIPIAAMVIVILVIILLLVLFGAFIYLYCRLRHQTSSGVSSAVSREPEDPKVVEEMHPELMKEPKPTGEKASILKKYQNSTSRPSSSVTTTSVVFANGITQLENTLASPTKQSPKSPSGKVQLPPISHIVTEKRKKKRTGERSPEKKQSRTDIRREPRARTPIKERMEEIGIDRVITPELLSTVEFNYIQPVYLHELETDTGRETVLSRKGGRIQTKKKKEEHFNENVS